MILQCGAPFEKGKMPSAHAILNTLAEPVCVLDRQVCVIKVIEAVKVGRLISL